MSENKPCNVNGKFCWNELVTQDVAGAKAFYGALFGWTTEPFGDGSYTLIKSGADSAGGMMQCPQPGMPSHWLPYVTVAEVDATVAATKKLGGKIAVEPFDVPTIGRLAVLIDPQGAAIAIIKPIG